ncbi:hypothetical protein D9615_009014 [Tricholomella constricta]|uniref:Uncharacterized protein n=1 Tax=Tricholomella constricta TaxID=117010 RepID=A0A8H5H131_9AGAR|nr:hypothetical protein D9615_009014 [Tricholomella constricta]
MINEDLSDDEYTLDDNYASPYDTLTPAELEELDALERIAFSSSPPVVSGSRPSGHSETVSATTEPSSPSSAHIVGPQPLDESVKTAAAESDDTASLGPLSMTSVDNFIVEPSPTQAQTATKRGRGRPKGSRNQSKSLEQVQTVKRPVGRPRGSGPIQMAAKMSSSVELREKRRVGRPKKKSVFGPSKSCTESTNSLRVLGLPPTGPSHRVCNSNNSTHTSPEPPMLVSVGDDTPLESMLASTPQSPLQCTTSSEPISATVGSNAATSMTESEVSTPSVTPLASSPRHAVIPEALLSSHDSPSRLIDDDDDGDAHGEDGHADEPLLEEGIGEDDGDDDEPDM